jgi:hypothetical protein
MFSIPPFRFNAWKHHLLWVSEQLTKVINNPDNIKLRDETIDCIKTINSNHVDVYTGQLLPQQIIQSLDNEMKRLLITGRNEFAHWLNHKEFQLITLQDKSVWVLRDGFQDELYVHIHPARDSFNALRIHGNTWKTVLVIKMFNPKMDDINLSLINEIRVKCLELSPVKNLINCRRLMKVIDFLEKYYS